MSTRSYVILQDGQGRPTVKLYRHWDGYPAEAGATLAEALKGSPDLEGAAAALLEHSGSDNRRTYELLGDEPGDIEHRYTVRLLPWTGVQKPKPCWKIRHDVRSLHTGNWSGADYGLADFIDCVNQDREAINRRLAERRTVAPKLYSDVEDYPMLTV